MSSLFQIINQPDFTIDRCKEQIEVATKENKTFIRQTLQAHLIRLLNQEKNFNQSITLASQLVRELKKVDDKELLVDVLLEESIAYYYLSNLTKSRASLTNARTIANSKYTPPSIQAKLDIHSGILHAADEQDFTTAYSYFYEAFEAFHSINNTTMAQKALKYMLLCKIMTNSAEEVNGILLGKITSKYTGIETDAMKALANAANKRSLQEFNQTFTKFTDQLVGDPVIQKHFSTITNTMFEKELSRLIQPYSCVQIEYISKCVGLDRDVVEKKICQMILDKKFYGCLQGDGLLVIFEKETIDPSFELAVEAIHSIGEVVDALGERAKKIK